MPHFFARLGQLRVHLILFFDVVLHFDEKPVRPKNFHDKFQRSRLASVSFLPLHESGRNFTAKTSAGGDEPLAYARDQNSPISIRGL